MCLSRSLRSFFEPDKQSFNDAQPDENRFLSGCARCMHLAGYLQPGPYVIETLLMYAQCKFYVERNPGGEVCPTLCSSLALISTPVGFVLNVLISPSCQIR